MRQPLADDAVLSATAILSSRHVLACSSVPRLVEGSAAKPVGVCDLGTDEYFVRL